MTERSNTATGIHGAIVAGLLLATALSVAPSVPASDVLTVTDAVLPVPRASIGAVWTGEAFILAGGREVAESDQIVRFDPSTNVVQPMQAKLPSPREWATLAWTGQFVYIVGGARFQDPVVDILRYDPVADTITTIAAKLPGEFGIPRGVWTGSLAILWPWCNPFPVRDCRIILFDPATETVTLGARIPVVSFPQLSGVWLNERAYFFGPRSFAYDPVADAFEEIDMAWLNAPFDFALVALGDHVYLIGSGGLNFPLRTLLRYTPSLGALNAPSLQLPFGLQRSTAVTDGERIYLLGGWEEAPAPAFSRATDKILRFDPDPGSPVAVIANPGTLECFKGGATVDLEGSGSFDPEGDALAFEWSAPGVAFEDPGSASVTARFPFGTTLVSLAVTAGDDAVTGFQLVRVRDTLPPEPIKFLRPTVGHLYVNDVELPAKVDGTKSAVAVGPLSAIADARDLCGFPSVNFVAQPRLGPFSAFGTQTYSATEEPFTFTFNGITRARGDVLLQVSATDFGGHSAGKSTVRVLKVGTGELCQDLPQIPCLTPPPV